MRARRLRLTLSGLALAAMFIGGLAFVQSDKSAPKPAVRPDHPTNVIPYTVRLGDSIGAIARMFGITPDELARANRMHVDEDLDLNDGVFRYPVPHPTEVTNLKSQVETLSAQQQAAEQKADAAEEQVKSLQTQVQELTGDNQDLRLGVKLLPWWRATAVSFGILALVTMFEWWRMRRRFVALGRDD